MPQDSTAVVLTSKVQIDGYRFAVIESCLKLQSLGMRHSRGNVATTAARDILQSAAIQPARSIRELYNQFKEWRKNWKKENGIS